MTLQYAELYATIVRRNTNGRDAWPVTVEVLAGYLYCSERNVKMLLHKMEDNGWIEWISGRGRGNRSSNRLRVSAEKLLFVDAKHVLTIYAYYVLE